MFRIECRKLDDNAVLNRRLQTWWQPPLGFFDEDLQGRHFRLRDMSQLKRHSELPNVPPRRCAQCHKT